MNKPADQTQPIVISLESVLPAHPLAESEWRIVSINLGRHDQEDPQDQVSHQEHYQLELYTAEAEAYAYNLKSPEPSLFIVLQDEEDQEETGSLIHLATLSPYEAQDYMDSGEVQVERILLPVELHNWLAAFVDEFYQPEEFKKRKRDKVHQEDQKFGKQPIFLNDKERLKY